MPSKQKNQTRVPRLACRTKLACICARVADDVKNDTFLATLAMLAKSRKSDGISGVSSSRKLAHYKSTGLVNLLLALLVLPTYNSPER